MAKLKFLMAQCQLFYKLAIISVRSLPNGIAAPHTLLNGKIWLITVFQIVKHITLIDGIGVNRGFRNAP